MEHICVAAQEDQGTRLDVFLAGFFSKLSSGDGNLALTRSRIQSLIREDQALLCGKPMKANYHVRCGDMIILNVPDPQPVDIRPQFLDFSIVFEDRDIIVVNKPRGMVVHPAAGNAEGTLVNALLYHCADLAGIGGDIRPGIVHRIDKDTTGLLVVAKNDAAFQSLAEQIKVKSAKRVYWALVEGTIQQESGKIVANVGRHKTNRKQMAVLEEGKGRAAITHFVVLERYGRETLTEVTLETGRTHQIRIHMAHIGHPVVGDRTYGYKKQRFSLEGQLLHAKHLELTHPRTGEAMQFYAELPHDFAELINRLQKHQKE